MYVCMCVVPDMPNMLHYVLLARKWSLQIVIKLNQILVGYEWCHKLLGRYLNMHSILYYC